MRKKIFKNQQGQTAILFVIMFIVLCGFCALALDVGQIVYQKRKMQNAIDLAVLSGGQELGNNTSHAVEVIKDYWELNGYNRGSITVKTSYLGDGKKFKHKHLKQLTFGLCLY